MNQILELLQSVIWNQNQIKVGKNLYFNFDSVLLSPSISPQPLPDVLPRTLP